MLPWIAFSNTVTRSAFTFSGQSHIIKQNPHLPAAPAVVHRPVRKHHFPDLPELLSAVSVGATDNLPSASIVLLPFIFITQQILAYALGFLFAIFDVFPQGCSRVGRRAVSNLVLADADCLCAGHPSRLRPSTGSAIIPAYIFIRAYHELFAFGNPLNIRQSDDPGAGRSPVAGAGVPHLQKAGKGHPGLPMIGRLSVHPMAISYPDLRDGLPVADSYPAALALHRSATDCAERRLLDGHFL
jgi:hypothetical protein